jgi:hypothetical protein
MGVHIKASNVIFYGSLTLLVELIPILPVLLLKALKRAFFFRGSHLVGQEKVCMFQLTDEDFHVKVRNPDRYVSSSVILAPVNKEIEEIGMVRCSCGNVIGEASMRVYDEVRAKINRHTYQTKTPVSETQYAEFLGAALATETLGPCCVDIVQSRPRLPEPTEAYIPRYIEDAEELLQRKRTAREGNIILERFEPLPYNPYTYAPDRMIEKIDEQQDLEDLEIRELSKGNVSARKQRVIMEYYPIMPDIDDEFEEEIPDLYAPVRIKSKVGLGLKGWKQDEFGAGLRPWKQGEFGAGLQGYEPGKYMVYGHANTGLRSYSVPVVRPTAISTN